jgi:acetyltransferase-like isoleucine patch superfamily enzyme
VTIGDRTLIGLGVTVNTGCDIGADVTVVSGVSVFDTVADNTIVRMTMTKHERR